MLGYIVAMSEYWLAKDGQQLGPYSIEEVQQRLAQGLAEATDLVWTEGMPTWEPLAKVVPVRRGPPPPPIPPPAPRVLASYTPPSPSVPAPRVVANYGPLPPSVAAPQVVANYAGPQVSADMDMTPPALHWALILLISMFTFGIFSWVWCLKEAAFAKKLEPASNVKTLMLIGVIALACYNVCYIGVMVIDDSDVKMLCAMVMFLCFILGTVMLIVGVFQIRRAMVNYYNSVEPIGLRMSGAMTFFFNILYIQHHYSRIANWKRTGFLQPQ